VDYGGIRRHLITKPGPLFIEKEVQEEEEEEKNSGQ
jgi:hypothetical protein